MPRLALRWFGWLIVLFRSIQLYSENYSDHGQNCGCKERKQDVQLLIDELGYASSRHWWLQTFTLMCRFIRNQWEDWFGKGGFRHAGKRGPSNRSVPGRCRIPPGPPSSVDCNAGEKLSSGLGIATFAGLLSAMTESYRDSSWCRSREIPYLIPRKMDSVPAWDVKLGFQSFSSTDHEVQTLGRGSKCKFKPLLTCLH